MTAVLSNSETEVGQPVQLQIQVTGASNPRPPGEIAVNGLEIRSAGTSRQYQMQNFSVSYSFTFTYMVTPLQAGTFTIPPQKLEVAGQELSTPSLTLTAAAAGGSAAPQGRRGGNNSGVNPAQIGFVEMLLPKQVAYVGEMIPVQVRLGLNMRAPVESLGTGLQIAGQGFTTQRISEPRQTVETVNGQAYQVFIFKTAISPARSGKFEIGPAEVSPVVRVPRPGGRNPMMPRGGPFDDPFFNNLFNDPAFAPSVPKEVNLKSEVAPLEVKPLPPKPPSDFSGAVGTFILRADASPKKAQVGDPITITATLTGRGNFDRVAAPVLSEEAGWHKYPASDSFKQDDDVGISGVKTFEMVVSAKENKTELPPLVFSFFDPVKEQYVTLRTEAIPLQIAGGAASAPTPAASAAPAATDPTPSAAPTAAPRAADEILPQLDDRPAVAQSFTPLYRQQSFWLAQLVPLLALLAFLGWQWQRQRAGDRERNRALRLQQETAELERELKRESGSPQEYFAQAARAVQLKTALRRAVNPNTVDADAAVAAFRLDAAAEARLRRLFEQSDELRYSGAPNGRDALSAEERNQIRELVENLRV